MRLDLCNRHAYEQLRGKSLLLGFGLGWCRGSRGAVSRCLSVRFGFGLSRCRRSAGCCSCSGEQALARVRPDGSECQRSDKEDGSKNRSRPRDEGRAARAAENGLARSAEGGADISSFAGLREDHEDQENAGQDVDHGDERLHRHPL